MMYGTCNNCTCELQLCSFSADMSCIPPPIGSSSRFTSGDYWNPFGLHQRGSRKGQEKERTKGIHSGENNGAIVCS